MKQLIIVLMLALSTASYAKDDRQSTISNSTAQAGAVAGAQAAAFGAGGNATGGNAQGGSAQGGTSSASINNDNDVAASSAFAPSVGTGNDCQIATPSSKAFSLLILSASGTTGVSYNELCYAYKRGQYDVADRLMCLKSQDYAKANPACGK